jgi:CheY-like chemotaxis protein
MSETCGADAPSLMVLVIEDVQEEREGLGELLTLAGLRVVMARTGFEAMTLAVERHPDVILMDLGLPGMDGLETTRHLKRERTTTDIPIIAITGEALMPDVERIQAKGFANLLTKPVDPAGLVAAIRQAARAG